MKTIIKTINLVDGFKNKSKLVAFADVETFGDLTLIQPSYDLRGEAMSNLQATYSPDNTVIEIVGFTPEKFEEVKNKIISEVKKLAKSTETRTLI